MTNESREGTIKDITDKFLSTVDPDNPPSPEDIINYLIPVVRLTFNIENNVREKGDKLRIPQDLTNTQISMILLHKYKIRNIALAGLENDRTTDLLCVYNEPDYGVCDREETKGVYIHGDYLFRNLAREYRAGIKSNDLKEVIEYLNDKAPRVEVNQDENLVPVNNGIFDYKTKTFMKFDSKYVFISKSLVNYNPYAITNPVIHNDDGTDWDVESWMMEVSDGNEEFANLLWQIAGAIVRPYVAWDQSAWFYSTSGNNGKGSLCELYRNLCGKGSHTSLALDEMNKEFSLQNLIGANAIIVDENNVGTYVDKAANLKAIITGDVLNINRKFLNPISYRFRGFVVQCVNEFPRFKDKSNSFLRRQIILPFEKCFTGAERKYIKHEYLHRRDVLEYVLKKVLLDMPSYYKLKVPQVCVDALANFVEYNEPVCQFLRDLDEYDCMDYDENGNCRSHAGAFKGIKRVPISLFYSLYKSWYKREVGTGSTFQCVKREDFTAKAITWFNQHGHIYEYNKNRFKVSKCDVDLQTNILHDYGLLKEDTKLWVDMLNSTENNYKYQPSQSAYRGYVTILDDCKETQEKINEMQKKQRIIAYKQFKCEFFEMYGDYIFNKKLEIPTFEEWIELEFPRLSYETLVPRTAGYDNNGVFEDMCYVKSNRETVDIQSPIRIYQFYNCHSKIVDFKDVDNKMLENKGYDDTIMINCDYTFVNKH